MNYEYLMMLNEADLHARAKEVEDDRKALEEWSGLFASQGGRFLLKEFKRMLYSIRLSYSKIPASSDLAPILLAGVQGDEQRVVSLIAKLEDSHKAKLALDEEVASIVSILAMKEKNRRTADHSLVPAEATKEKDRA